MYIGSIYRCKTSLPLLFTEVKRSEGLVKYNAYEICFIQISFHKSTQLMKFYKWAFFTYY